MKGEVYAFDGIDDNGNCTNSVEKFSLTLGILLLTWVIFIWKTFVRVRLWIRVSDGTNHVGQNKYLRRV